MFQKVLYLALLSSLAIASLSAGVLTGDMVNLSHQGSYVGQIDQDMGTQAIPNGSLASYVYDGGTYTANIYENYVDLIFTCGGCTWSDWSFFNTPSAKTNAVGLTRLSDAAFTGVSIDATTSYAGFNASRLSFTANQIFVELKGLPIDGFIRLNLQGDTVSAVPEPATMSMMPGAFGVIGLVVRRRRAV